MAGRLIPASDNDARLWLNNFAGRIHSEPGRYQIAVPDSVTIYNAALAYDAAYNVANTAATRNVGTVNAKDVARNSAEGVCRLFAAIIKRNAGVSDDDKLLIGVPPINNSRERRNCPAQSPVVAVIAATQGAHTLRYIDGLDTESRSKPFGATEIELFVAVAPTPVMNWNDAKFYRKFTTNPMAVAFEPGDNGKTATYFARWAGRRGDVSNWSSPISMAIAA